MSAKGRVVVIGSGAGGASAAKNLARREWDVTLVEDGRWGGICLWTACMPKKALYHCARAARIARAAEQYGVSCEGPRIDWQSMLAWKWHSQETYAGDQRELLSKRVTRLVEGTASFTSPTGLEVAGETLEFDHCVIATGSRPISLGVPGAELADTSEVAIGYRELPRSLAIVGAGFVAMEMAGIFASLGTKVSVVAKGQRVLPMLDEELAAAAHRHLQALGVDFFIGGNVQSIQGEHGRLSLTFSDPAGAAHAIEVERVLSAIGRRPDFSELRLQDAGVATDDAGHLVLDQFGRTTNPSIWACGDATGGLMQTPVANFEGRVVAESIDTGHPMHADCSAVPVCCFTVPQLATVGLTEASARGEGRAVRVSRTPFEYLGEAIIEDERDGFVKLVADDADGRIIGAQIAAPNAADVIYSCALAIRAGMTLRELGDAIAVHPSFAEAVYWSGE